MAEFDTNTIHEAEGPVRQVEWCGNDAILVTWDTLVVLVGPYGDTLKYAATVSFSKPGDGTVIPGFSIPGQHSP